jgi:hypothetical protein
MRSALSKRARLCNLSSRLEPGLGPASAKGVRMVGCDKGGMV